ncbi:MAG: hypothetical protein OIF58_11190 [Cohaesibacter sp.]|nr:hypothetical protein [Cohaesibacter sp.]
MDFSFSYDVEQAENLPLIVPGSVADAIDFFCRLVEPCIAGVGERIVLISHVRSGLGNRDCLLFDFGFGKGDGVDYAGCFVDALARHTVEGQEPC